MITLENTCTYAYRYVIVILRKKMVTDKNVLFISKIKKACDDFVSLQVFFD